MGCVVENIEKEHIMKKTKVHLPEIKLVGMTVRTSNLGEANFETGKIFPCIKKYFHEDVAASISNRKNPGTTYCVYADYESDHNGEYTYLIGEEVNAFDTIPPELETYTIKPQTYTKFTNGPAPMPHVRNDPWGKIWGMREDELGGKRRYHADFEIYDERAKDHDKIVLDIYIGLKE